MLTITLVLMATLWGCTSVEADCQKSTAIGTLDLKSLEGKWYQLSSFGTMFIHHLDRCQVTTITAGSDGKSFVMANDRIARLINTHIKYNWNVEANGEKLSGDLTLRFKMPIFGVVSMPLKILGTDNYKNYIILYICREFASIFKFNAGFILTKKRHYHAKELESIYTSIDDNLKKNGLSRSMFSLSIQTNCEDKSPHPSNSGTASSAETTGTSASTSNAVDEQKTSEHTGDKKTMENSEKTSSGGEKIASITEKVTDSTAEKVAASTSEKVAASETETSAAS